MVSATPTTPKAADNKNELAKPEVEQAAEANVGVAKSEVERALEENNEVAKPKTKVVRKSKSTSGRRKRTSTAGSPIGAGAEPAAKTAALRLSALAPEDLMKQAMSAAKTGDVESLQMLLEKGAGVNSMDNNGL